MPEPKLVVRRVVFHEVVRAERGHANLLPVALAAQLRTVILTDSHEFATARLA
jgi:hypothetical protein